MGAEASGECLSGLPKNVYGCPAFCIRAGRNWKPWAAVQEGIKEDGGKMAAKIHTEGGGFGTMF